MRIEKLSINKVCAVAGVLFSFVSAAFIMVLYRLTGSYAVISWGLLFSIVVLLLVVCFITLVRCKLILFSNHLCGTLDEMLTEEIESPQIVEGENLFYKISQRLVRLYEVMRANRREIAKERSNLQELISDISHQVKTPVANLKMLDATLLEQDVPPEKQREFLLAMGNQLDKLDFLMRAMIETSRLEAGAVSLVKKNQPVYNTLASALGGILLGAEKKKISVHVNCAENLSVSHDRKWTGEALFNILDNAVKYTLEKGSIQISVEKQEMYLKIDITDTGKGIAEKNQGAIFKRFYREEDVHEIDGIGIGLYLAREIITMQGGYIRVSSKAGRGSTFSVFLPCT